MSIPLTQQRRRPEPVLEVVRRSSSERTVAPAPAGPARPRSRVGWWAALGVVAGCAAGIAIGAVSARARRVASVLPPPPCPHALVTRGPTRGVLRTTAPLALRDMVRIGTALPGQVVSVKAKAGDQVSRGQPLVQLDDLEQKIALVGVTGQVAAAELADVRAERRLISALESQYGRPELPEDWSADEILEGAAGDAQITLFQTGAQLEKHQALLALARRQLARRLIRAPIDGKILALSVAPGESIGASPPGPPLLVIGSDPVVLRITAAIDAAYVARVQPGPASFKVAGAGDRSFPATVIGVVPANVSQQSPTAYEVSLDAPNDDGRLLPGMPAVVSLTMESPVGTLEVPVRAVTSAAQAPAVVVVGKGGTPRTIPVRVGVSNQSSVEVEGAGLKVGDLILADAEACGVRPDGLTAAVVMRP